MYIYSRVKKDGGDVPISSLSIVTSDEEISPVVIKFTTPPPRG
jgi:hypothetical protein